MNLRCAICEAPATNVRRIGRRRAWKCDACNIEQAFETEVRSLTLFEGKRMIGALLRLPQDEERDQLIRETSDV